jgi:hypothetical protein
VKPENGCCGTGIRLIQQPFDVVGDSSSAVVQKYVTPYLVDGYKFDFRFFLLIADLQPFTCYVYQEGIARFCTKPYHYPSPRNLSERFRHITNTAVNVENTSASRTDFTKLASVVIAQLGIHGLWERIKNVATLTLLALYPQILSAVIRHGGRRPAQIDPFHGFFHILGIDILVNEMGEPVVLELNDRPSMKVTFQFEHALK